MPRIQIKKNATTGCDPAPTDLIEGEIAANTADGKLYIKMADGSVWYVQLQPVQQGGE